MSESPDTVRQFTATTNAAVAQARLLADDAVAQIDAGTFGCEAWGRSMVKFFDIVARGSASHFRTAVAHGCGTTAPTQEAACGLQPSGPIHVAADPGYSRQLSIQQQFTQVGGQVGIPDSKIAFHPTNVLAAGATSFSVRLLDARYMGASYTGTVRLTTLTGNLVPASYVDRLVTVEL
ncbi:hypothetical protein [Mycobacterium parmense]|uniref:Uncharacterized protein n=1 Tax=Mycobacterium parmense TaxID=185642 RepID=A0A7I7YV93_9MYCO|nr:hypothetical protein [Mycobacterium parmense]MCV7351342.1 hypothetical protein [Mycobacterium parmense]ORW60863.1 hypothetical protein AWC20_07990 [Mycobacterium parmense]BBZ45202.1 hypothetical protein MPRM_24830 [Mycobacterium parmense]